MLTPQVRERAYLSSHLLHSNSQTIKDLCLPSVLQYKEQLNCFEQYRQMRVDFSLQYWNISSNTVIFILHCSTITTFYHSQVFWNRLHVLHAIRVNSLHPDNNYVSFLRYMSNTMFFFMSIQKAKNREKKWEGFQCSAWSPSSSPSSSFQLPR